MPIYKDENSYKVIKLDSSNQPQDYDLPRDTDIATEQEMQNYIFNMTPANITASGGSLIIEFEPFPKKYVNYMRQRQYNGRRTQVFWQLVRYVGRTIKRRTNVFASQSIRPVWRDDETNDLYHWTFPTRRILTVTNAPAEGSMRPYYFSLTPKEATLGRIIWSDGYNIVNRFRNRPFGEARNVFPKKIAIIIGMATHGMLGNGPWIYKKSNSFIYNVNGPIIPSDLEIAISEANITMTKENDDYFISFSNINTTLITYAEENKTNNNYAIFLQTFNYFGGQAHGTKRLEDAGTGVEKKIKPPSKNQYHRKNIGLNEFENGVYLSEITQGFNFKHLYSNYKYESETFHNMSVALVLANPGMNEGFHTYKESNKINII